MIEIKTIATGSKGNAYVVTDGVTKLLLECGIPFKNIQKAMNYETDDIQGCLISHEHMDHCKGLQSVLKAGITIYTSEGTKDGMGVAHHRIKVIQNKVPFVIGTWTILPFDVSHDVNEPFGFLLQNGEGEKLLFATDTYYIKYKFPGLTHLMIECNYCQSILDSNVENGKVPVFLKRRVMKSHFSLENVLEFLRANDLSKVKEIWLLHLSDNNSDEQLIRNEVAKLTGKMIYIP